MIMKSQPRAGQRQKRGVALLSVIGILLVLLVFAGGLIAQLDMETHSVRIEAMSNRALNAADAGVHAMVEQIQTNLALNLPPPGGAVTFTYPEPSGTPASTSYSATIDQTWPAGGLNYYLITSTGTFNNGIEHIQRQVRAIAKSVPISSFASFSNYEVNQFGKPVWYLPSQHFDGPVYSGGPMRIAYATPPPSGTPSPIFGASVVTLNTPVWNPGAPGSANDWASVVNGGSGNFSIDKTALSLPQPSNNIYVASEAWEGDGLNSFPTFPSVPAGVYMDGGASKGADAVNAIGSSLTTGIFVNGGNSSVTINSSSSGGTEKLVINGSGGNFAKGAYNVIINYGSTPCSGSTTVTQGSFSHTFTGTPCGAPGPGVTNTGNGAIYVENGNVVIGNPNATFQGDYTIVTPDFSGWSNNNITMLGSVQYDPATASTDKLALWANDVIINTAASNITIDASIIAGYPGEKWNNGDFRNARCTATGCGTIDQGTLTLNGGLIENARGAVGEVLAGSQFGFSRIINFDSRFATSPPPFNPSTGALSIIAWEDLGS